MAKIEIDFEWPVAAHYSIKPNSGRSRNIGSDFLVASGKREFRRPLEMRSDLYSLLLTQGPLQEKVALIAATCGMLTNHSLDGDREPLSVWSDLIDDLRHLHKMEIRMRSSAPSFSRIITLEGIPAHLQSAHLKVSAYFLGSQLDVGLKPRKTDGRPTLILKPWNLRDAIKLQCAQAIAGGATIRECANCGDLFEAGGEGGKRVDSRYCSDACRYKFNNQRNLVKPNKSTRIKPNTKR